MIQKNLADAVPKWLDELMDMHKIWKSVAKLQNRCLIDLVATLLKRLPVNLIPLWLLKLHDALVELPTNLNCENDNTNTIHDNNNTIHGNLIAKSRNRCMLRFESALVRNIWSSKCTTHAPSFLSSDKMVEMFIFHHDFSSPLSTVPQYVGKAITKRCLELKVLNSETKELHATEQHNSFQRIFCLLKKNDVATNQTNSLIRAKFCCAKIALSLKRQTFKCVPQWARLVAVRSLPVTTLPKWLTQHIGTLLLVMRTTPLQQIPPWVFQYLINNCNMVDTCNEQHQTASSSFVKLKHHNELQNAISILSEKICQSSSSGHELPAWVKSQPHALVQALRMTDSANIPQDWWVLKAFTNKTIFEIAKQQGVLRRMSGRLHVGMEVVCTYRGYVSTQITGIDNNNLSYYSNTANKHHDRTGCFAHRRYYWNFCVGALREFLCRCDVCNPENLWLKLR